MIFYFLLHKSHAIIQSSIKVNSKNINSKAYSLLSFSVFGGQSQNIFQKVKLIVIKKDVCMVIVID